MGQWEWMVNFLLGQNVRPMLGTTELGWWRCGHPCSRRSWWCRFKISIPETKTMERMVPKSKSLKQVS